LINDNVALPRRLQGIISHRAYWREIFFKVYGADQGGPFRLNSPRMAKVALDGLTCIT